MKLIRAVVRAGFAATERGLGRVFPAPWNPLLNLGALGFLFYWIITVSGIYLFIFFDTSVDQAYTSVEYMTRDQWYAAGVMRSLHRYASDGLVLVMVLHLLREFGLDRYRGVRWFSWVTGVPVLVLVFVAGITGYWMVWDKLAQYVAVVTTEWLDRLRIFGEPIARNFLSPEMLESRFFTLMVFMHIAVPLLALILLWIHLQRVTKPRINPPRGLTAGALLMLLVLSLVHPATSQGAADLSTVPGVVGLDWFYLPAYPLLDKWPGAATWGGGVALLVIMLALPWMPPLRKSPAAVVDLTNCNGCARCYNDCPYAAISMVARTDGAPFEAQAAVDPSLCVACGICAGACPTAMPFRKASALVAGIDLPDFTMAMLRDTVHEASAGLTGPARVMVFGCAHGAEIDRLSSDTVGCVHLRCVGQLPPSFIDYTLSRGLADGIVVAGCASNSCHARFGNTWTDLRVARARDPYLRARVPAERLKLVWVGTGNERLLEREVSAVAARLTDIAADVAASPDPVQIADPARFLQEEPK